MTYRELLGSEEIVMSVLEIVIRLALSILIGGVVGYNREYKNRPAGFRTHVLVCLGATVAALIQVQLCHYIGDIVLANDALKGVLKVDSGRVICQVISGIGFLGAGTIIQTKGAVKGLTTAASIWAVGCVGIAIGMGFYEISILGGISIVIVLVSLKKFESRFIINNKSFNIEVIMIDKIEAGKYIKEYFDKNRIKIKNIKSIDNNKYLYKIEVPQVINLNDIVIKLINNDNISSVEEVSKLKI